MKELKPRDKVTQRMTRDGLMEENQTTGEAESVTERSAEQNFSPQPPPQPFSHSDSPVMPHAPELPYREGGGTAAQVLDRMDAEHTRHKSKRAARKANRSARAGDAAAQRPSSRLSFTDEERAAPELQKAIRKSDRRADKLDAARDKIPKKRKLTRERSFDESSGTAVTRLHFERVDRAAPKLKHNPLDRPASELGLAVHGKIHEVEQDNVGVESGHKTEELAEREIGRSVRSAYRRHKLKPYRVAEKAERKALKANADFLYQKTLLENPQLATSNPISRLWQRQQIKRQYAKAVKAGGSAAAQTAAKTAKKAAQKSEKAASFVARHWKGALIVLALVFLILSLVGGLQSCSVLFGGAGGGVGLSSYQSEDADLLAAEADYCALEAELQDYLDHYESTHSYDEYHFDLDEIEHDPYVLLSILSALHEGAWMAGEVQGDLAMLFEKQYILTETVTVEQRYYIETDTWTDEDGNSHSDSYRVYYDYYICNVSLENFNLSHVPVYIMGEDTLSLYALYMSALGNRSDLFPTSGYVSKYITNPPDDYAVPEEYRSDETFNTILTEAEKYLGYPYVWGGSSPQTSFDCSGFVSWVLTDSGVCNTGRLGAQGLYNICTPVSRANAKPGDLIFFVGTYDTPGVSHCGIYVGDGMMIHCGDPINYSSIDTSYWQTHFYAFGRPRYR